MLGSQKPLSLVTIQVLRHSFLKKSISQSILQLIPMDQLSSSKFQSRSRKLLSFQLILLCMMLSLPLLVKMVNHSDNQLDSNSESSKKMMNLSSTKLPSSSLRNKRQKFHSIKSSKPSNNLEMTPNLLNKFLTRKHLKKKMTTSNEHEQHQTNLFN